ncbi:hypothetical protein LTR53_001694 [Teratosphaeriaceae sp. CCFEE 6253]|nr:hypothetical protein LTR53_001694 [Teratosphaeriaceae sp. CCFEE 6253]
MVTASQEKRGVAHGSAPDAARPLPGRSRSTLVEGERRMAQQDTDPYQERVWRIEEMQWEADPEYMGPSQEMPTTLDGHSVGPQEDVGQDHSNAVVHGTSTAEDDASSPSEDVRMSVVNDETDVDAAIHEPYGRERSGQTSVRAQHSLVSLAADQRTAAPLTLVPTSDDLQSTQKQRKKVIHKEKFGVRHTTYVMLGDHGQRERDELIHDIRKAWPGTPDSSLWPPDDLAPARDGVPLPLQDVSSSLLRELKRLSEATNNVAAAHEAMSEAVALRILLSGKKRKLTGDDIREALKSFRTPRKRTAVGRDDDSGEPGSPKKRKRPSADRPAHQPAPTAQVSATLGRSQPSPARLTPGGPAESPAVAAPETPIVAKRPAPEAVQRVSGSDDDNRGPHRPRTPPMSPDVLSQVWKMLKTASATSSVQISTEVEWSESIEKVRELYYLTCLRAKMEGRDRFTITFDV